MALTSTITANGYQPFMQKFDDYTPPACEILQTTGNAATTSSNVIASATASDEFFLNSLAISIVAPTAGAEVDVWMGTDQIYQFPTCAADVVQSQQLYFGEPGLMGGTTTTMTVSIVSSATITCRFVATGKRKT